MRACLVLTLAVLVLTLSLVAVDARPNAVRDGVDPKTFDKAVDKALAAYNDEDYKKFFADFAKAAEAIATEPTFKALYVDGYKKSFGKYVSRELNKKRSSVTDAVGVLLYDAVFEKEKNAEIAINLLKEGNDYKFIQIQINKAQKQ